MNTIIASRMVLIAMVCSLLFLIIMVSLEIVKARVQNKLEKEGKDGTYKVTMPWGWTFQDFTLWEAYEFLTSRGAKFYGKGDIFSGVFYVRVCPKYRYPIHIHSGHPRIRAKNEFCLKKEDQLPARIIVTPDL